MHTYMLIFILYCLPLHLNGDLHEGRIPSVLLPAVSLMPQTVPDPEQMFHRQLLNEWKTILSKANTYSAFALGQTFRSVLSCKNSFNPCDCPVRKGPSLSLLTCGETKEHLPKATQLIVAEPGFKLSPGWPHRCLRPVLTDRGCDQQGDSVSRWCQSSRTRDCGADTGSSYMEGMGILEPGQGEVGLFQSWGSRIYGDWEVQVTDIRGSQLRTEGLSGLRSGLPKILIRSWGSGKGST